MPEWVNHEDLMRLVTLEVNGKSLSRIDVDTVDFTFEGKHPWSVLLPVIKIELLSPPRRHRESRNRE